jgi:transmembrane sensor
MQEERISYLIGCVLDGSANTDQRRELSEWAASISDGPGDARPLEQAWLSFEALDRLNDEKAATILSAILNTAKEQPGRRVFMPALRRLFVRTAAAAAILLLLGTGVWLALRKTPAPLAVNGNAASRPDAAAPQTTRAILTLSDGARIALDSARNDTLTTQGGSSVVKLSDGQLAYRPGNTAAGEQIYNTISLPRGSRPLHLTLADGSMVWLNTASSIRYPVAFTGKDRKVTITGEAWFDIAKDPSRPFTVSRQGDPAEVQVLGTAFNINAYEDEGPPTITLVDGSVRLVRDHHTLILKPGQQARATGQGFTLVANPDLEQALAWKNGRFIFNHAGLASILRQLGRWYDLEPEFKDQITDNYTVSVSRDVPVSRLFQFIELSGGVHFNIEGKKIMVTK